MASEYETMIYQRQGRIGYITFNRPGSLNAVNDQFVSRYAELYQDSDLVPLPSFTGGSSYAAPFAFKQAIESAGGTNSDDMVAELEGMTVDSPFGEITLDPDSHQANSPTVLGRTTQDTGDMDLPYDGAALEETQTYTLDRETSLDLLEGSGLPPGV